MFDSAYKEAFEDMKLSDSFKTGLVDKMKKQSKKPAPRKRLVLAVVAAVILVSTSVVFATNYATDGQLFKSVMSGFGYDPQKTKSSVTVDATQALTPGPTEVPTATPTETVADTPAYVIAETSVSETSAVTQAATAAPTPEETAAPTPKETTAPAPKETTAAVPKETTAPAGRIAPAVSAAAGTDSVTVSWGKIYNADLVGYKVVASRNCSTPKYSENGYYAWITDANTTSCTISNGEGYNGGDVGTFSGGTSYYFSVTAVYGDEWQKVAGNAVKVTMPGSAPTEPSTTEPSSTEAPASCPAVTVSASAGSAGVNVSWSRTTDTTGFIFYKVVASAGNSAPSYPDDGYVTYITDPNITSYFIGNTSGYNGGDFGGTFASGTTYYFSITACYDGGNARGNAVSVKMP